MSHRSVFIPRQRLEIPFRESNEVVIESIREANPHVFPLKAAGAIMLRKFIAVPIWEPWQDEQGGNLHIAGQGGRMELAVTNRVGKLETPFNSDGFSIHQDERTMVTFGPMFGEMHGIAWGFITHSLDEILERGDTANLWHVGNEEAFLQGWYNARFVAPQPTTA